MSTYVIVGGVAGGATAAARLRRRDESAQIVVLERGEHVSYANCGLPYYVGQEIEQREALFVSTPAKLTAEFALDVRTRHEVVRVDRAAKEVEVRDLAQGSTYRLAYDKLILSPGAAPIVPPIPGVNSEGVFTLRSVLDTDAIKARVDSGKVRHAVVVGGGFIGLEMAENLVKRGVAVTVVELVNQVMISIDYEMAALVHRHLRDKGVRLSLGDGLKQITPHDGLLDVVLASGKSTQADMVILAIGVRPETDLAKAAGLTLGPRGHIVVDEFMRTSDPAIYAVGDAVQVTNPVTGQPTAVPLAGPANRQARIAADHITGRASPYQGTIGASIVKVFDQTVARVGASSKELEKLGMPFRASITHSYDHASYYPGATFQSIKLIYAPETGRLLGAQVVGYHAVDRTIDTLAVAIKAGMSVYDLEHLELAYAPPYGSAKDPVNIAGYTAANDLRGDTKIVQWSDVARLTTAEGYRLLDVRAEPEYQAGHLPDAILIPHTQLRQRLAALPQDAKYLIYCRVGRRGYVAERLLRARGYDVCNLTGGSLTWQAATEKQDNFAPWTPPDAACVAPTVAPQSCEPTPTVTLNACGLQCPGPILAVYRKMQELQPGQELQVQATDPGFRRDVGAWAESTGNRLLDLRDEGGKIVARLQKGGGQTPAAASAAGSTSKTMIVFDGNLDHALAAMIIANGAAAMGQRVSMFFTFWGLNILRRPDPKSVSKTIVERMFGWMMPKGARALKLSKLHMAGMGTAMMKGVMKHKNVDSLETMIRMARDNGVRMIACQMTMDLMGIKPEELIDGVELGGVATMLNEADKGNALLFV